MRHGTVPLVTLRKMSVPRLFLITGRESESVRERASYDEP